MSLCVATVSAQSAAAAAAAVGGPLYGWLPVAGWSAAWLLACLAGCHLGNHTPQYANCEGERASVTERGPASQSGAGGGEAGSA